MQSPPTCSNEQREQKQTAYRFRYALGFLLYHTTQKMSNHSFCFFARISIGYPQLSSKNRLDKPEKIAYNKSKESTPVDGLLPRLQNSRLKLELGGGYFFLYAKYARTARKTLQKMLTTKEITSIIMHHLPSIQIEDCGSVDLTAYRFRYALEV